MAYPSVNTTLPSESKEALISLLTAAGPRQRAEPRWVCRRRVSKKPSRPEHLHLTLWTQPHPCHVLPTPASPSPQSGIVEVWQVRARDNKACD